MNTRQWLHAAVVGLGVAGVIALSAEPASARCYCEHRHHYRHHLAGRYYYRRYAYYGYYPHYYYHPYYSYYRYRPYYYDDYYYGPAYYSPGISLGFTFGGGHHWHRGWHRW